MNNYLITFALRTLSIFFPPQKPLIFAGHGTSEKLAEFIVHAGQTRPLIVTDSFLYKNGMLDGFIETLEQKGCSVTIFDDIIPNPTYDVVRAGCQLSVDNRCDAVLAVGGGSAIDAAKVIAAASTGEKTLEQLKGIFKVKNLLPFYAVPTTSGTGSEVTTAAVISESESHKKNFFVDPKYIPVAVALDTALLTSLPPAITATTGMDALTHAIEAYTSRNRFTDTDRDAAMAIKLLLEFLPIAYEDGDNLKAREMVAIASFLAGYAFTKSSLGYVHAISHQISSHYNTAHGLANAVILPRVLRFNKPICEERYATLERLCNEPSSDEDTATLANKFIQRVDQLSEQVGIPKTLDEVSAKDYNAITKDALAEARSSYAVPRVMKRHHVGKILESLTQVILMCHLPSSISFNI